MGTSTFTKIIVKSNLGSRHNIKDRDMVNLKGFRVNNKKKNSKLKSWNVGYRPKWSNGYVWNRLEYSLFTEVGYSVIFNCILFTLLYGIKRTD